MTAYRKHDHNEVYQMVRKYYLVNGCPPSLSEVGRAMGIKSKSHTHYILNKLVKFGLLRKTGETGDYRRYEPVKVVSNETTV